MNRISDRLDELCQVLPQPAPEAMARLGRLVRQVAHDLKNPLATFAMELYMLRRVAERIAAAASDNDPTTVRAQAAELLSMCDNLEAASDTASAVIGTLEESVAARDES